MQLSSTTAPSILPGGCYGPRPAVDPGPIGVSYFGTLRIGHALNGVTYTEHVLEAPLAKPLAHFTGSLADAIKGTQQLLGTSEAKGADRQVVALTGLGNDWYAQVLFGDPTVVQAVDHGAGTGGIASIDFTKVSRSLGALVTSQGTLAAH
jgi:hypothetical protein